jgi:hypothetical protein
MSSHGSATGFSVSDLIPLNVGKENEWKGRMEMRLGSKLLWDIVSGQEKPDYLRLKRSTTTDPSTGTPTKNLSVDFEEISRETSNALSSADFSPEGINRAGFLVMQAKEWKNRHDKAFYYIKECLSLTEYGMAKATELDFHRDNVAEAWRVLVSSFISGNMMMKKLMIRINHYRHFAMREEESFEAYLGRVMLVLGEYREANRGAIMDECDLLGFLCVGMGPMFQRIVGDLGRMNEDEMKAHSAINAKFERHKLGQQLHLGFGKLCGQFIYRCQLSYRKWR